MPEWSILIATVGARNAELRRIADCLHHQLEDVDADRVEVVVYWDNFDSTLGEVRQALLDDARGDYVNFVDDDDEVPSYYVERVLGALDSRPAMVGWRQQLFWCGKPTKPTFHSLQYDRWWEDADGYYRHVSHLNPLRVDLARLGRFDKAVPEDVDWAHQVHAALPFDAREVFIDEVMYRYFYDPASSLWSKKRKPRGRYARPVLPSEQFRFHPASSRGFAD